MLSVVKIKIQLIDRNNKIIDNLDSYVPHIINLVYLKEKVWQVLKTRKSLLKDVNNLKLFFMAKHIVSPNYLKKMNGFRDDDWVEIPNNDPVDLNTILSFKNDDILQILNNKS